MNEVQLIPWNIAYGTVSFCGLIAVAPPETQLVTYYMGRGVIKRYRNFRLFTRSQYKHTLDI